MAKDVIKTNSIRGLDSEASSDQLLAGLGDVLPEVQMSRDDLVVPLEGDVSTDHVIQQDTQTPNRGTRAKISIEQDPFRRSINSGA